MPKASGDVTSSSPSATPTAVQEAVSAPVEFLDLDDAVDFVKALYFGVEGTGKTTAACFMANLPGDGDVIVINAEAGLKKGPLKTLGVDTSKIKIWQSPSGLTTYDELEKLYFQLSARLRDEPGSIKGVILDSVTEITNKFLEAASRYWYDRDQRNDRKSASDKRETPEITELQDYGLMTNQTRKLMRKFRDLPCHFAATALETEAAGDGEYSASKKQAAPEMSPKVRVSVLGYVDVALRLSSETLPVSETESETLVTARTKPSMLVRAKDRYGILPRDMPEPRFDRLVEYVNGDVAPTSDPLFGLYEGTREKSAAYRAAKKAAKTA